MLIIGLPVIVLRHASQALCCIILLLSISIIDQCNVKSHDDLDLVYLQKASVYWRMLHKENGQVYQCLLCLQEFSKYPAAHRHVRQRHLGITYRCRHCPKVFGRQDARAQHERAVHGLTQMVNMKVGSR